MTRYYPPRHIIGHGLMHEGAPHDSAGRRLHSNGSSGKGRAKCRCGELSDQPLESAAARKRWHNEHKDQLSSGPTTTTVEPGASIAHLADISYRGRDTGIGLAKVVVDELMKRGWSPPTVS